MSWLTGALEQATAMAPPTERHAIHKLWNKMEDATADCVKMEELTPARSIKLARGAFTNLCNMYVEQAQQSALAKAEAEEARAQMLEERERFREHSETYRLKLDAALGVARVNLTRAIPKPQARSSERSRVCLQKSSSVAEDWRGQVGGICFIIKNSTGSQDS